LTYHFFPSADQSVAEVLQKEIEKHREEEKRLLKRKEELKKAGIEVKEGGKGEVFPGFNPKLTDE